MIDVTRVLIPTDFSETSDAALRYGVELARRFGARLFLLHVTDDIGKGADGEYPIGLFESLEHASDECLLGLLDKKDVRELRPHCSTVVGLPAEQIVRYAHNHGIDLIVMGTHGREGVARAVLGSVAETVVRRAACPVLTVHRPEREFVMEEANVPVRLYATV